MISNTKKELIGKDVAQLQAHKTELTLVSILLLDLSTLQHPLLLNSVWKHARESGDLYATKIYRILQKYVVYLNINMEMKN